MRSFSIFAAVLLCLHVGRAQATYPFLRVDVAPRVAAMGGAFTAMQGDANVLFSNPASIAGLSRSMSVGYLDHLLDIASGSLVLATDLDPIGTLAFGVLYTHYGEFDRTDAQMNSSGTFSATDLALIAGTGHEIAPSVFAGVNVKYIHSSIATYASSAIAADGGILYAVPDEGLTLGASVLNAGVQLSSYNGVKESLPLDVRFGITKRPEHLPVWLNLDLHRIQESGLALTERVQRFSFGAEFDMSASLRLRVGYNNALRKDLKFGTSAGLAGFSGGFGINLLGTQVDYAFNSYGAVGGLHRFGVSTRW